MTFELITMIDIKVPTVGESINEVTLVKWLKQEGDWVERDEVIAELESEKATFEINAEKVVYLTSNHSPPPRSCSIILLTQSFLI